MSSLHEIKFHFLVSPFAFRHRKMVKAFILDKLKESGRKVERINYIFCDDTYLLDINRTFLSHDTLTDIITFELCSKNEPLVSDIYISVERVRENAITFKTTFSKELHRVIFHGLLHILGFKDKTDSEKKKMHKQEDEFLKEFFHVEHKQH